MMRTRAIDLRFGDSIDSQATRDVMLVTLLFLFLLTGDICQAFAGGVQLEWDQVTDHRVHHYQVHYGRASGQYDKQLDTTSTSLDIDGLEAGANYYFAARACDESGTECSDYSNELHAKIPVDPPSEEPEPPVAGFSADVLSGEVPLTVTFSDQSEGKIRRRTWDFGDGGFSSAATAVHTYNRPGIYSVSLTVRGPGGKSETLESGMIEVKSSASRPGPSPIVVPDPDPRIDGGLALEIGEVELDHEWRRVDFQQSFSDPILVLKALSANGGQPALIRVRDVDATGFWVRVQEWDYLDGSHVTETASYLAMERGRHQLPDGTWVEAGSLQTDATNVFQYQAFAEPFAEVPVVFAAVSTVNGAAAVNARLDRISADGFFVGMSEEESSRQVHSEEVIHFVAWEASTGVVQGLRYEVGRTAERVNHLPYQLTYESVFERAPVLVADMQTSKGGDAAALRWQNLDVDAVDLWVQEEQSMDEEMAHTREEVGYFVADVES